MLRRCRLDNDLQRPPTTPQVGWQRLRLRDGPRRSGELRSRRRSAPRLTPTPHRGSSPALAGRVGDSVDVTQITPIPTRDSLQFGASGERMSPTPTKWRIEAEEEQYETNPPLRNQGQPLDGVARRAGLGLCRGRGPRDCSGLPAQRPPDPIELTADEPAGRYRAGATITHRGLRPPRARGPAKIGHPPPIRSGPRRVSARGLANRIYYTPGVSPLDSGDRSGC